MESKSLLDIPAEVICHNMFNYLELNDLLRVRRVCKQLKILASDQIRLHEQSTTELTVYVGNKVEHDRKSMNMESLMKMELMVPNSKFALTFRSVNKLLEDENTQEFLQTYGNQIEELRMSRMSVPLEVEEAKFYGAMPNLKRLTIEEMDATKLNEELDSYIFPRTFKQLTHFSATSYRVDITNSSSMQYLWDLLDVFEKLEYFGQPEIMTTYYLAFGNSLNIEFRILQYGTFCFTKLNEFIRKRCLAGGTRLKFYDMKNFRGILLNHLSATSFQRFCRKMISEQNGLQVLNVDELLTSPTEGNEEILSSAPNMIVSMVNLNSNILTRELPVLEKLKITGTSVCGIADQEFNKCSWPALKILDLTVDSIKLADHNPTSTFFDMLFLGLERPTVTELRLNFGKRLREELAVPRTKQIVSSCFNLTKLTIERWSGTNKALCILWQGLSNLKEICLNDCKELGNVAFVGANVDNPIFLKLEKLENLSLLNVDQMPKITDTVFRLVFRHLKLKEFRLTSSSEEIPLKSITQEGIRQLLKGVFARTIEKFPFDKWTLDGITKKEFQNLKMQFRSSSMI